MNLMLFVGKRRHSAYSAYLKVVRISKNDKKYINTNARNIKKGSFKNSKHLSYYNYIEYSYSLTTKASILLLKVRTSAKCEPKKAITFYKNTQTCFSTPIFLK